MTDSVERDVPCSVMRSGFKRAGSGLNGGLMEGGTWRRSGGGRVFRFFAPGMSARFFRCIFCVITVGPPSMTPGRPVPLPSPHAMSAATLKVGPGAPCRGPLNCHDFEIKVIHLVLAAIAQRTCPPDVSEHRGTFQQRRPKMGPSQNIISRKFAPGS